MASTLDTLSIDVILQNDQLKSGLKQTYGVIKNATKTITGLMSPLMRMGFDSLFQKYTRDMTNLYMTAIRTGKSSSELYKWGAAIRAAGGSVESAIRTLEHMSVSLGGLAIGDGTEMLENLAMLGVEAYDAEGNLRPMNDILIDISKNLTGLDNATRTHIMQKMGISPDVIATVLQGEKALRAYLRQAELAAEQQKRNERAAMAYKEAVGALTAQLEKIGAEIMPTVTNALTGLIRAFTDSDIGNKLSQLFNIDSSKQGREQIEEFRKLFEHLVEFIERAVDGMLRVKEHILNLLSALDEVKQKFIDFATEMEQRFNPDSVLGKSFAFIKEQLSGMSEETKSALKDYGALAGLAAFTKPGRAILGGAGKVILGAGKAALGVGGALLGAGGAILGAGGGIIGGMGAAGKGVLGGAAEAGKNLWRKFRGIKVLDADEIQDANGNTISRKDGSVARPPSSSLGTGRQELPAPAPKQPGFFSKIGSTIKSVGGTVRGAVNKAIDGVSGVFKFVDQIFDKVKGFFNGIFDRVKNSIGSVFGKIFNSPLGKRLGSLALRYGPKLAGIAGGLAGGPVGWIALIISLLAMLVENAFGASEDEKKKDEEAKQASKGFNLPAAWSDLLSSVKRIETSCIGIFESLVLISKTAAAMGMSAITGHMTAMNGTGSLQPAFALQGATSSSTSSSTVNNYYFNIYSTNDEIVQKLRSLIGGSVL